MIPLKGGPSVNRSYTERIIFATKEECYLNCVLLSPTHTSALQKRTVKRFLIEVKSKQISLLTTINHL